MKYIISAEGPIARHLSELLTLELARFDIRAEIRSVDFSKSAISKEIRDFKPDMLVAIGSSKSKPIVKLAKNRNIRTSFFYLSVLDKYVKSDVALIADRTYLDLPGNDSFLYTGNLLYELIRKNQSSASINEGGQNTLVSVFTGNGSGNKRAANLVNKLSNRMEDINFKRVVVSHDVKTATEAAQKSNAIIALDQLSNMFSVFTNCPVINVYDKSLFTNSGNKTPIINSLLEKEITPSISSNNTTMVIKEVERVLNDHQYCASILASYQELKSLIGISPVARQTAQDLVDWLENAD